MASNYQSEITKHFESKGWLVIKLIKANKDGYPDLLMHRNGVTQWIECKEANDTLKPLQAFKIRELNSFGIRAVCMQAGEGVIYPENEKIKWQKQNK